MIQIEKIAEVVSNSIASQNPHELRDLLAYVDKINPSVILEIGAWKNYSLANWHAMWPKAEILGIEIDPNRTESIPPMCTVFQGDSREISTYKRIADHLNGRLVDFLFIDGDHTYDSVKIDFARYSRMVRKGGIVAFHDVMLTGDEWKGLVEVNRFFNELIKDSRDKYEWHIFSSENGTGVGVLKLL